MKKEKAKKPGRPQEAVPEDKAQEICEWISLGKTLRQWCRNNKIHYSTVYLWMQKDPAFAQRFAQARDIGTDCIADETLDISDNQVLGVTTKVTDRGIEETLEDMLGHRKLQIETRLKLLAKWNPKKYGEKLAVGGADDLPPVKHNVSIGPDDAYLQMVGK